MSMDFLKALFNDDAPLTYAELEQKAQAAGISAVNIADGGYVSRDKYNAKVNTLNSQIADLTQQVSTRDTDLAGVQAQLAAAQTDAGKLSGLQQSLDDLTAKYNTERQTWEQQRRQQAYEFRVRELANDLKFTSAGAKKAFVADAIGKNFSMDGETLLGYKDFLAQYQADDPGAFVQEAPPEPAEPAPQITIPAAGKTVPGRKMTIAEMMKAKNENPNFEIKFD